MSLLSIENLRKVFSEGETDEVVALEGINLEIEDEEFICLVGPSGCGKTTLLRIVAGLDTPSSGVALLAGNEILGPDPERGMVFQEYSLFPWLSVIDNIEFGLEMKGVSKKARSETSEKYLELVGLKQFAGSFPHELSGGMRQRVAIARALANDPKVLLMDEPFGALDAQTRNMMQKELLEIWRRAKKTVIFVTHSVDEAVFLADRIIIMSPRPGKIKEIVAVDIPRCRERTAPEFANLRKYVLSLMGEGTI
ncbi:MAG: ABC transporter ATP-binding protein [Methanomicrobiaceae archaeon]|nr:ABC transporter ATP-binding protein [Methanomicrobiaceae archaeon]